MACCNDAPLDCFLQLILLELWICFLVVGELGTKGLGSGPGEPLEYQVNLRPLRPGSDMWRLGDQTRSPTKSNKDRELVH